MNITEQIVDIAETLADARGSVGADERLSETRKLAKLHPIDEADVAFCFIQALKPSGIIKLRSGTTEPYNLLIFPFDDDMASAVIR